MKEYKNVPFIFIIFWRKPLNYNMLEEILKMLAIISYGAENSFWLYVA